MNKLYVMIGAPGSGKSTFAKKYISNAKYISRDEIRFSILAEDEPYFSKEDQVYREFIWEIYNSLKNEEDVVADATNLNDKSRSKLFEAIPLDLSKYKVIAVYMNTPLKTCLERNELRKGVGRTYVPPQYLRRMFFNKTNPTFTEYKGVFNEIWNVFTNDKETIVKKYNIKGLLNEEDESDRKNTLFK